MSSTILKKKCCECCAAWAASAARVHRALQFYDAQGQPVPFRFWYISWGGEYQFNFATNVYHKIQYDLDPPYTQYLGLHWNSSGAMPTTVGKYEDIYDGYDGDPFVSGYYESGIMSSPSYLVAKGTWPSSQHREIKWLWKGPGGGTPEEHGVFIDYMQPPNTFYGGIVPFLYYDGVGGWTLLIMLRLAIDDESSSDNFKDIFDPYWGGFQYREAVYIYCSGSIGPELYATPEYVEYAAIYPRIFHLVYCNGNLLDPGSDNEYRREFYVPDECYLHLGIPPQ